MLHHICKQALSTWFGPKMLLFLQPEGLSTPSISTNYAGYRSLPIVHRPLNLCRPFVAMEMSFRPYMESGAAKRQLCERSGVRRVDSHRVLIWKRVPISRWDWMRGGAGRPPRWGQWHFSKEFHAPGLCAIHRTPFHHIKWLCCSGLLKLCDVLQ